MSDETKERPIIFDAESIRAILSGIKTQTRRVVKFRPPYVMDERDDGTTWPYATTWADGDAGTPWMPCPYGDAGDLLWVREACRLWCPEERWHVRYRADGQSRKTRTEWDEGPQQLSPTDAGSADEPFARWSSPIHMPRWASRITLRVDRVRVQRLHEITEDDACAEGAQCIDLHGEELCIPGFRSRWDAINAKRGYPWQSNPWVWAVTFSVVPKEGAE